MKVYQAGYFDSDCTLDEKYFLYEGAARKYLEELKAKGKRSHENWYDIVEHEVDESN